MIRTTLRIARRYARENPAAPRLTIGDLSRPHGGDFGPRYGSIGHASHQNGLDVDIYYPRRDRRERPPDAPRQVDLRLSQKLVDMFVAAGAEKVFIGPSLDLRGPPRVVAPLVYHDNHIHVRLPRGR
jgi:murein endopeptidase